MTSNTIPPIRACIFDVDGTLIDSEDVYTEIYNKVLHEYGKPDMPWSVKARLQSRGRDVPIPFQPLLSTLYIAIWANEETRGPFISSRGPN